MSCSGGRQTSRGAARGWRGAAALALLAVWIAQPVARGADRGDIRTVSVAAAALESVEATRLIIPTALEGGFNTVLVPISLHEAPGPARAAAIDAIIRDAHERGMRVHAAVQVTVAAPAGELPASRDHVIYQHPEWLMVPRELAIELLDLDPRSPDYLGRVARWTRAHRDAARGLQLSPLQPEVVDYIAAAVRGIAARHAFDGLHLDGIRFSGPDFDYSRRALEVFRAAVRRSLDPAERARLDAVETLDPFGYTEELPAEWRRFRTTRLTALVARLRSTIRAVRPDAVVSASVVRGADRALGDYLQDWRTWLDNGFVDALAAETGNTGPLLFSYDSLIHDLATAAAAPAASGPAGSH